MNRQQIAQLKDENCNDETLVKSVNELAAELIEKATNLLVNKSSVQSSKSAIPSSPMSSHRMVGPDVCTSVSSRSTLRPFSISSDNDELGGMLYPYSDVHSNATTGNKDQHKDEEKQSTETEPIHTKQKKLCGVLLTNGGLIMKKAVSLSLYSDQNKESETGDSVTTSSTTTSSNSNSNNNNNNQNLNLEDTIGLIHIINAKSDPNNPRFYFRKLPFQIAQKGVILADSLIGTGNRARMALHVLLDHHVKESNICFICLIASRIGLISLARFFPKATVFFVFVCSFVFFKFLFFVCGAILEEMDNKNWVDVPGIRNLVSRYCKAAQISFVEYSDYDQ
ncbi:hypothetical protein RFI_25105 [Reticulomyxa filosa]|uniref:Phosphoribosyltransferase domain-containing protein n=1 Tax=Reticulomyxa filosa TaxID=46433 RepID=X6MED5_RETFI|nr:hypothetical protein RFI_25105 [Reticulomyxa filosa]|eukprot:ETO12274.1 hypothetical protein RFI_25105 [Reticulomyxa filosa]